MARQFGISWREANGWIRSGFARFDRKSPIDAACSSLANQNLHSTPRAPASSAQIWRPTVQQARDARLALCQAVLEIQGGHAPDNNAMRLAMRGTDAGAAASARAVNYEWIAYVKGEWSDGDCRALSTAPWAESLYMGDPIRLAPGTIRLVVHETSR